MGRVSGAKENEEGTEWATGNGKRTVDTLDVGTHPY